MTSLATRFCFATVLLFALVACGDDDSAATVPRPRDGGNRDDGGGSGPRRDSGPDEPVDVDSGVPTGMKPPELASQACAVDTNKLYELVAMQEAPRPTQLAVDLVQSHFAFAYVGPSETCIDSVFLTQLSGASGVGMPDTMLAADDCTTVDHVSVTHNGENWLLAIADARMGPTDLWLQPFGGEGDPPEAIRLTETIGDETESAIAALRCDQDGFDCDKFEESSMVAWIEEDPDGSKSRLMVRPLALGGTPSGDAVMLDESEEWHYIGLTLQQIGEHFFGLGYRRFGPATGKSEIVLEVFEAKTGQRNRDGWVLSASAGPAGSVDLGTDGAGGGVLYSLGQAQSQQLWFQQLDAAGRAAPVMSGDQIGGPSDPVRIVGPPVVANDASLTKLPRGFAVSYRVLGGVNLPQPRIRAHFLDRYGREIGKSDVALAKEFGARTAIESAYDGRITIGWSDTDDEGDSTLTAVKLPCVGGL